MLRNATARDNLVQRTVRRIPGGSTVEAISTAVFDAAERAACSIGDNEERPGDRLLGQPGQPGQCDGVRYFLTITFSAEGGAPSTQTFNGFWGPIQGIRILPREGGVSRIVIDCRGRSTGGPAPDVFPYQFASTTGASYNVATIDDIQPQDNFVDNCGVADTRPSYSGPITYNEGGTEITQNVEITLDESINNGPSLTIPFLYVDPNLELRPELDLDLEPEISLGGRRGCDVDIEVGNDNTSGNPESPLDDGQPGNIVGAVVVSTRASQFQTTTELSVDGPPTLFFPRCASLLFGLRVGNNRAWAEPQDCNVLVQYLDVPGDIPAYTWKIIPALGFTCEVFPVRQAEALDVEPEIE